MKNLLFLVIIIVGFASCNTPNKTDIAKVDDLLAKVDSAQKELLAIDTAEVFEIKRLMESDYKAYAQYSDTITKQEAFRVDEIFGYKKRFVRISKNYKGFVEEIEQSHEQLVNLKTDLENGLIEEGQFPVFYDSEVAAFNSLNSKIVKATTNFSKGIAKYKLERNELLELIAKRKERAAVSE